MIKKRKVSRRPPAAVETLRNRLRVAEDTLQALRAGEVDALVVTGAGDEHIVTFQGAELPYRLLLEQMYAGAVTLTPTGTIVYCNRRFADIVRTPLQRVVGSTLSRFAPSAEQAALEVLVARGGEDQARGDLAFRAGDGTVVPVSVTFAPLRLAERAAVSGVIGVVVDSTERKRQDDLRKGLIEQVVSAQDDERARIARELHDETGQSLTALLVGLRTIEESATLADAAGLAQQLRGVVAQTLEDVGRLSRGLHPSILDDIGLVPAVTRMVQESAQWHGLAVDLRIEGLDAEPLPRLLQTTVHRVLQEALSNVARHAGARRVTVRLLRDAALVQLMVQDDGSGFVPVANGRLGLRGMRERAALLGGSVEVESPLGVGTTITAILPLPAA